MYANFGTDHLPYATACIYYFVQKFGNDPILKVAVSAFKYGRYFNPVRVGDLGSDIDNLSVFPFLKSDLIIDGLKTELPKYLATVNDISVDINKIDWWRRHAVELPLWASACKSVLLVQPSSATAERVFLFYRTILKNNKQML